MPINLYAEYGAIVDSFPSELSRTIADLRELDAVVSSTVLSLGSRANELVDLSDDLPNEARLRALSGIAEEARRVKVNAEDKVRAACLASEKLYHHSRHMSELMQYLPGHEELTDNRRTSFPHVGRPMSGSSYVPETGRRRRIIQSGGLLNAGSHGSPHHRHRL